LLDKTIISHDQINGPDFSKLVTPQGYGWWYADAISDDGQFGFSIIAMIGSVFSPYYAWSGREKPNDYVALNVGLYGKGVKRWTMTERTEKALIQTPERLVIGPSSLEWDGETLLVHINEWANPIFRKVEGTLRLTPSAPHRLNLNLIMKTLLQFTKVLIVTGLLANGYDACSHSECRALKNNQSSFCLRLFCFSSSSSSLSSERNCHQQKPMTRVNTAINSIIPMRLLISINVYRERIAFTLSIYC